MGLDQYLYAIILPIDNEKHNKLLSYVNNLFKLENTVSTMFVKCEVAYWRKNLRIYNYFDIMNHQYEKDISIEELVKLLLLCKEVYNDFSKIDTLLPLPIGFDENMNEEENKEEIVRTIDLLTKIIDIECYISFKYEISY